MFASLLFYQSCQVKELQNYTKKQADSSAKIGKNIIFTIVGDDQVLGKHSRDKWKMCVHLLFDLQGLHGSVYNNGSRAEDTGGGEDNNQ